MRAPGGYGVSRVTTADPAQARLPRPVRRRTTRGVRSAILALRRTATPAPHVPPNSDSRAARRAVFVRLRPSAGGRRTVASVVLLSARTSEGGYLPTSGRDP